MLSVSITSLDKFRPGPGYPDLKKKHFLIKLKKTRSSGEGRIKKKT